MTATVGLARTLPTYAGLRAPFGPGYRYPEFSAVPGSPGGGPNHVYAAVRSALAAAGLDAVRFGRSDWNPLGSLARSGSRIVLKPNFIRHWNPAEGGTLDSLVTHGALLRVMVYVGQAAGCAAESHTMVEAHYRQQKWGNGIGTLGFKIFLE